jgi:hypothetical protein
VSLTIQAGQFHFRYIFKRDNCQFFMVLNGKTQRRKYDDDREIENAKAFIGRRGTRKALVSAGIFTIGVLGIMYNFDSRGEYVNGYLNKAAKIQGEIDGRVKLREKGKQTFNENKERQDEERKKEMYGEAVRVSDDFQARMLIPFAGYKPRK